MLHLVIGFSSAEKRAAWETAFTDAKQKLCKLLTNGTFFLSTKFKVVFYVYGKEND